MSEIYFKMENGKPTGILVGAFDAIPQTFRQSMPVFIIGMAIVVISVLFFILMPIILLIKFLLKKEKKSSRFICLSNCLLLVGTLFVLNFIFLILSLVQANVFIQTSMITPHIWINYILLAASVVVIIVSQNYLKRDNVEKKSKLLYFSTISLLTLFIFVLWNWNYFVMM